MWPRKSLRMNSSYSDRKVITNSFIRYLVTATIGASCSSFLLTAQNLQVQPTQLGGSQTAPLNQDARIGAGDLIDVRIFDVPELSASYRVSGDGQLDLPLIGKLQVSGKSASDVSAQIAASYQSKGYVLDPQVTVRVLEFSTEGVTIEGDVKNPGNYPTFGPRSLSDALALAGGLGPTADTTIQIQHRLSGSFELVQMPSQGLRKAESTSFLVVPGDSIFVPRAGVVYVLGQVARPGGIVMRNNGHITALQALSEAQGLTKVAAAKNAFVLRNEGQRYTRIPLDLKPYLKGEDGDLDLRAEDILVIPASAVKVFFEDTASIIASLSGATLYALAVRN